MKKAVICFAIAGALMVTYLVLRQSHKPLASLCLFGSVSLALAGLFFLLFG